MLRRRAIGSVMKAGDFWKRGYHGRPHGLNGIVVTGFGRASLISLLIVGWRPAFSQGCVRITSCSLYSQTELPETGEGAIT